jgi:hypothetical protein
VAACLSLGSVNMLFTLKFIDMAWQLERYIKTTLTMMNQTDNIDKPTRKHQAGKRTNAEKTR